MYELSIQTIILIYEITQILSREKDGYPNSVKSHKHTILMI